MLIVRHSGAYHEEDRKCNEDGIVDVIADVFPCSLLLQSYNQISLVHSKKIGLRIFDDEREKKTWKPL
jgi:hypothetical protein